MTELQHRDRFFVKQRLTMMVNRYEIRETKADGSEGAIIAMVLPGLRCVAKSATRQLR